jgi:hypothetical protein
MPCLQNATEVKNATSSETGFRRRHPSGNSGSIVQGSLSGLLTFSRCTPLYRAKDFLFIFPKLLGKNDEQSRSTFIQDRATGLSNGLALLSKHSRRRVCRISDVGSLRSLLLVSTLLQITLQIANWCARKCFSQTYRPPFIFFLLVRKMLLEILS